MKTNIEDIKTLRKKTQASYAACKEALIFSNDLTEAERYLIKKGLKTIDSISNETKIGIFKSYTHPGDRICAVVEVSCETDFVAKTSEFQTFAKELAMQVASMKPKYIDRSEILLETISDQMSFRVERLNREGFSNIEIENMLYAEMEQWYSEVCLLEQSYIKDNKKAIKDLLGELNLKMQEDCRVKMFKRFEIGEEFLQELPAEESYQLNTRKYYLSTLLLLIILFIFTIGAFKII